MFKRVLRENPELLKPTWSESFWKTESQMAGTIWLSGK
jgi:hypothetical protein